MNSGKAMLVVTNTARNVVSFDSQQQLTYSFKNMYRYLTFRASLDCKHISKKDNLDASRT